MPFNKIILLAGKWDTTPIVYNFLQQNFNVQHVIIEEGVPRKTFLKKRIRKLGLLNVAGQVLFQLLIGKPLGWRSQKRISEIIDEYKLSRDPIPEEKIKQVPSVNSEVCLEELNALNPDLVIVHGTRIISKKILQGSNAAFINIHAGITPRYRGSHGAYWALLNNDKENCGVTVHFVDAGIDTGNILGQERIPYNQKDNFSTYGYLQLAVGLELLKKIIHGLEKGERPTIDNNLNSALWHHPTIWKYLWKRWTKGVK